MNTENRVRRGRPRKYPEGAKRVDNTSLIVTKKQKEYIGNIAKLNKETVKETSNRLLKEVLDGKFDYLLTPIVEEDVPSVPVTVDRKLTHEVQKYLEGYNENASEVVRKIVEEFMIMTDRTLKVVGGYELGVTSITKELKRFWLKPTEEVEENMFFMDASIQLDIDNRHVVIREKSMGVRSISQMEELKRYKDQLIETASQLQDALDTYVAKHLG